MNKTTVSKMIFGAVLLLFTACTQDELAEQGNTLPDGEYPLQIGSVSITAEASEEPWTRVAENETDGMGSHWTDGDKIGVRIGDNEETGIYIINVDDAGNVTVEPETPVYWKSTQTAEVTAWYPAEASSVNLGFQHRNGLTYVLHGTGTGNHQSPVTLGLPAGQGARGDQGHSPGEKHIYPKCSHVLYHRGGKNNGTGYLFK